MKKFFEKHDLVNVVFVVIFIAVLLSWILPEASYSEGELVLTNAKSFGLFKLVDADTRAGLFDLGTYGLLGFYYFVDIFVFLFVCGGFYKFMGSTDAYKRVTEGIAKSVVNAKIEAVFAVIVMFVLAVLTSISSNYLVLFAVIPFFISILSNMKVDKVTGVATTYGAMLVGIMGSILSGKVVGQLVSSLTVKYSYALVPRLVLFAITFLLLAFFVGNRIKKVKAGKITAEPLRDIYEDTQYAISKKDSSKIIKKKVAAKKVSAVPLVITFVVTAIILLLAFIDWTNALGFDGFTTLFNWIKSAELFNMPIFYDILGASTLAEFGSWDLFAASSMLLFASLIIKFIYGISFDKMANSYVDGIKATVKPFIVFMLCYVCLEVSVLFVRIPGIVDAILGIAKNPFTLFISAFLTSIFTVDIQYVCSLIGTVYSGYSDTTVAALILQTAYGLFAFIGPTSAVLLYGLGMTDTKYKDWFKFIWKFLIAIIVVIVVILAIVTLA